MIITYTKNALTLFPYYQYVRENLPFFHKHVFWEFTVFIEGTSINHTPEKDEYYYPYTAILMRPHNEAHTIKAPHGEVNMHLDIYVHDEKMKKLCALIDMENGESLYDFLVNHKTTPTFSVSPLFLSYAKEQFTLLDHPNSTATLKENIHSSIVLTVLSAYVASLTPRSPLPLWLESILNKLKNPLHFQDRIEELVAGIPYSRSQICREFKKLIGKTIVEYFNEQKVIYSAHLLLNTNYKIIDIANTLGYSSPKNFIQQFTKHFSCSPSAWRKKVESTTIETN